MYVLKGILKYRYINPFSCKNFLAFWFQFDQSLFLQIHLTINQPRRLKIFSTSMQSLKPKMLFSFIHSFKNFGLRAARLVRAIFRCLAISIGSVHGLAPDGCQAITWTNGNSFQWCICIVRPQSGNSLTVSQAEQLPFQYNIWESIEYTEVYFPAYILAAKVWNHYSWWQREDIFPM